MKKLLALLLMLILPFALAACGNNEEKPTNPGGNDTSEPTPETPDKPQEPEKPTEEKYETRKDYYYEFTKGDENSLGKTATFNNLSFTSSFASKVLWGKTKNLVQIGTNNAPETNFILEANFGEKVKVTSFSAELATNSSSTHVYTVTVGDYTKSGETDSQDPKPYTLMDINTITDKLTLNLKAKGSKGGVYIKSIAISLLTKADSKLDFTGNTPDKPVDPDKPVNPDKPVEPELPQGSEIKPGQGLIPKTNYTLSNNIVEEYYKLFDLTLKGNNLRKNIATNNKVKTMVSYGDSRYMLQYTDEMINKPGYVFGMYDGLAIKATWESGTTWNREHVWACNHMQHNGISRPDNGDKNHMTDLHNLRACTDNVNSSRGNKYFSQLLSGADYYDPNSVATGGSDHRGDVARILFYMYAQYDFLLLNDKPNAQSNQSMGILSELLKWNEEDPVDKFEIRRNNRIYEYQGNRNPFIDHPSLAKQLFA